MTKLQKSSVFLLRISLGWLFFYSGITKIMNPDWSAGSYLNNAKAFTDFYGWLASPDILPIVTFVNEWGQLLLGLSLLLGIFIRISAPLGAAMMILYWLPLGFPYPNNHSYIVDQHIIYAAALLLLASLKAGRTWGLDKFIPKKK
jgi:thiosulfate dehydrogenase [quinone] large subunit